MLTNSFCANSDSTDWRDKEYFRSSLNLPTRVLREGARPEIVGDKLGHVDIDVTQNVYGKRWCEGRVVAVTRASEASDDYRQ